ncbi:crossover junction endonuclease EME1 [Tachyglossus aculeatus]|uniref:crossover junction endonuclease EME1 n=1 Tax=Tachyglossus aculeatus TaxID=9261 RepID=UPI0018F7C62D|nr:crossover junction endonuclease EME1 [Tachyglossus aculeatus]XP_038613191.1 crossover junction endonuclease EME1 [Tachyglossus aculeatus]
MAKQLRSRRSRKPPPTSRESDSEEEPPTFTFLKQPPPPSEKSAALLSEEVKKVVVLSSSDSEDPHPPFRPKATAAGPADLQDPAEIALSKELVLVSSGSEEEEVEEELIPLAERVKGKVWGRGTSPRPLPEAQRQTPQSSLGSQTRGAPQTSGSRDTSAGTEGQCHPQAPAFPSRVSSPGSEDDAEGPTGHLAGRPSAFPAERGPSSSLEMGSACPSLPKRVKRGPDVAGRARLKRQEEAQERERRKALAQSLKAQRPEECLKHIAVLLDPALLQLEGGGQILSALQSMECACEIEGQAIPCSMAWKRRAALGQVAEGGWTEEPGVLVVLPAEEFMLLVHSPEQSGHREGKGSLQSFVADAMVRTPGKVLSLAVVGVEKLCRRQPGPRSRAPTQARRRPRGAREDPSAPSLSRVAVEEALVELQLQAQGQVQVRLLESWQELADYACMFTKAVAEAPYKRLRDCTGFSFYLESTWAGGVKVDRAGTGLGQVWRRQLQQLNRVSLDMASAIVAAYPSPRLLLQAYSNCSSTQERQQLLAGIQVRRGVGVTATARCLGPELSRRVYLQMTSLHPDLSLDILE